MVLGSYTRANKWLKLQNSVINLAPFNQLAAVKEPTNSNYLQQLELIVSYKSVHGVSVCFIT